MCADIIEVNFETLETVGRRFEDRASNTHDIILNVTRRMEALQADGWMGRGAEAFYGEMTDEVLPQVRRLAAALEEAAHVTAQIMQTMSDAEHEAQGKLNGTGDAAGVGASAAGVGARAPLENYYGTGPADTGTMGSYRDGGLYDANGSPIPKDTRTDSVFVPGVDTDAAGLEGHMAHLNGENSAVIYNRTDGMASDFAQAFDDRFKAETGIRFGENPAADTLYETIKNDIENGDGVITVEAHSQGGAITAAVLTQLHNEGKDLSGVTVITYGSFGTDYPPGPDYTHYVITSDPVPMIAAGADAVGPFEPVETMRRIADTHYIPDYPQSIDHGDWITDSHSMESYRENVAIYNSTDGRSGNVVNRITDFGRGAAQTISDAGAAIWNGLERIF